MNAFDLIEQPARSDPFWVGRLSAAIALSLPRIEREPKIAKHDLKAALDAFMEQHPDGELKQTLREYMR